MQRPQRVAKVPTVMRMVRSKHDAQMVWPQDKNGASPTSKPQYVQQGALVMIYSVYVCVLGGGGKAGGAGGDGKYGKGEI